MERIIRGLFYSNIFLGICAVALCVESNLLAGLSLNFLPFYVVIFLSTCVYYTMIYVRSTGTYHTNKRTLWYKENRQTIICIIKAVVILTATFIFFILLRNRFTWSSLSLFQWLLLGFFPVVAAWYTFTPGFIKLKKIRDYAVLKPFVIGITWAGWVTVYPVLFWQVQKGYALQTAIFPPFLLWLQNFIFFSIIAIIFDVKDHQTDLRFRLQTFPVRLGIKKTVNWVIIPLFIVNISLFVAFQLQSDFSVVQSILQAVPFVLLLLVILTHRQQKTLLYYLAAVDGLLLVKAVCGITSILFFKK